MPDFQPASEVIHLSFYFAKHALLYWSWLLPLLAEYSACPSSQDNCLQYSRPNFYSWIQIANSGSVDVQICYNGPNFYQFNLW
jgi:hypothetical protein